MKQTLANNRNKVILSFLFLMFFAFSMLYDLFSLSLFQYADELLALLCWIVLLYRAIKGHKFETTSLLLLCLFFVVGLISLGISGYSRPLTLVVEDFFVETKFLVFYCVLPLFVKEIHLSVKQKKRFGIFAFILSLFIFSVCLKQVQSGLARALFFSRYAGTPALYAVLLALIQYLAYLSDKKKGRIFFLVGILLDFLICFMAKSNISYFGFLLILFLMLQRKEIPLKRVLIFSIVVFGFAVFVSWYKIFGYFMNSNAPRAMFFSNAFAIANSSFPFGKGLSMYGSSIAANNYSPLYYELGFSSTWELGVGSPFLCDTFLPSIIGEFGYLGCGVYLFFIWFSYKHYFSKDSLFALIFLLFVFVSFTTSAFFNTSLGYMFLVVTTYVVFSEQNIENKEDTKMCIRRKNESIAC